MVSSRVVSIIKYILAFFILISVSNKNPLKKLIRKLIYLEDRNKLVPGLRAMKHSQSELPQAHGSSTPHKFRLFPHLMQGSLPPSSDQRLILFQESQTASCQSQDELRFRAHCQTNTSSNSLLSLWQQRVFFSINSATRRSQVITGA